MMRKVWYHEIRNLVLADVVDHLDNGSVAPIHNQLLLNDVCSKKTENRGNKFPAVIEITLSYIKL